MRRGVLMLATAVAAATLSACGGGDVAVVAALEAEAGSEGGETVALGNLQVRLLPYDRDVIFDSLEQAYTEPEPQLPDSLAELQAQVQVRQAAWLQAENRWGLLRDSLAAMVEDMNTMDQSTGEYFVLFQAFGDLEAEVEQLQEQSGERFRAFTSLQTRLNTESREINLARQAWADEAFAPVDSIIDFRLEEMGLEELADTTTAQGVARFDGAAPGSWWVYARYERQYDELYWNEPIEVARGEELVVRLSRENAEVRPTM